MEDLLEHLRAIIRELPVSEQERQKWLSELRLARPVLKFVDALESRIRQLVGEYEQSANKQLADLDASVQHALHKFQILDEQVRNEAKAKYAAELAVKHSETLDTIRKKLQQI